MSHWAAQLIGRPWTPDGLGPNTFGCWGMVRWVFKNVHGIDMPSVALNTDANVNALCNAAHVSGWRPIDPPPEDGDIIMMNSIMGRHVGVMLRANGMLGVLHSNGYTGAKGPVGSVVFQRQEEVTAGGYHNYEYWRRV